MSLHLTNAIADGGKRVLTRTGGVLFLLLFAQQALLTTSINTLLAAQVPSEATAAIGLTLPVSGTFAGAILVGSALFTAVYFVALSRAFTRPVTQLSSVPTGLFTRRVGRASLTMLLGGLVVSVAVTLGLAVFVIPGLFLATCFLFFIFAVGVEDRGVLGALKRSWTLSKGNRLRLAIIVVLTGVSGTLIGVVPAVFQIAGAPALGDFFSVLLNSTLFTLVYAIMSAAYLQLTDGDGGLGGTDRSMTAGTNSTPEV